MIMAVNKPVGMTSHDVVERVRRLTGEQRVGHGGTLDPLAEGVLVIGVGREGTKQLGVFQRGQEKEYTALIRLGASSATDDAEGPLTVHKGFTIPSEDRLKEALGVFEGKIEQVPPQYSAVKISGVPAHRRMRKGQMVNMKSRRVTIHQISLLQYDWPEVKVEVVCGSGVYIRALARDLGAALTTGGYLAGLCRTRVGRFTLQDATPLDRISGRVSPLF